MYKKRHTVSEIHSARYVQKGRGKGVLKSGGAKFSAILEGPLGESASSKFGAQKIPSASVVLTTEESQVSMDISLWKTTING